MGELRDEHQPEIRLSVKTNEKVIAWNSLFELFSSWPPPRNWQWTLHLRQRPLGWADSQGGLLSCLFLFRGHFCNVWLRRSHSPSMSYLVFVAGIRIEPEYLSFEAGRAFLSFIWEVIEQEMLGPWQPRIFPAFNMHVKLPRNPRIRVSENECGSVPRSLCSSQTIFQNAAGSHGGETESGSGSGNNVCVDEHN